MPALRIDLVAPALTRTSPVCTEISLTTTVTSSTTNTISGKSVNFSSDAIFDGDVDNIWHNIDVVGPLETAPSADDDWLVLKGFDFIYDDVTNNKLGTLGPVNPDTVSGSYTFNTVGDYYVRSAVATSTTGIWTHSNLIHITVTDNLVKVDLPTPIFVPITNNPAGNTCADAYLQFSCIRANNGRYEVYLGSAIPANLKYSGALISITSSTTKDSTPKLGKDVSPPLQEGSYTLICKDSSGNLSPEVQASCLSSTLNNPPRILVTGTPRSVAKGGAFKLSFSKLSPDNSGSVGYVNPKGCKVFEGNTDITPLEGITNTSVSLTKTINSTTVYTLTCYPNIGNGSYGSNDPYKIQMQEDVSSIGDQ